MDNHLKPARPLLAGITLGEFLSTQPPRTVLSVAASDPLALVLRRFAVTGLVAAPLFADEARTKFLRFIDLMDVVSAVVTAARAASDDVAAARLHAVAAARALAAQTAGSVPAAANDAQVVYQLTNTLEEVVREGFVAPVDHLACHRLAVFQHGGCVGGSPGGTGGGTSSGSFSDSSPDLEALEHGAGLVLTHIVSQTDMLRFLHKHRQALGRALLGSSLSQLGFGEKRLMCVTDDLPVFDALAALLDNKVPAVAVISVDTGVLVGTLSIADLRGILPEHFDQLLEPVGEFLSGGGWRANPNWQPHSPRGGVAAEFGIRSPEQRPHAPALAACTADSTFGEVVQLLVERGLHRVFVVDGEGCPAGVVSSTDVLRLLVGGEARCQPEP